MDKVCLGIGPLKDGVSVEDPAIQVAILAYKEDGPLRKCERRRALRQFRKKMSWKVAVELIASLATGYVREVQLLIVHAWLRVGRKMFNVTTRMIKLGKRMCEKTVRVMQTPVRFSWVSLDDGKDDDWSEDEIPMSFAGYRIPSSALY
ncbi:MAG: hypothetical protein EXS50_00295 [Candidatus Taylorbacteria bacterium]|nr:hypothetical protein [Candidatus Taylorbacteria bacterium]